MAKITQSLRASHRNAISNILARILANSAWVIVIMDQIISSNKQSFELLNFNFGLSRLFIYVHHSKTGLLDKYDKQVLKEAKSSGFSTILVSNGRFIDIKNADYIFRKNRFGRDFAVLRDMARSLKLNNNQLISFFYMNNSMVWKDNGISELIDVLEKSDIDTVIFPTESYNPVHHVQPYFVFAKLEKEKIVKFSSSFEWIKNFHFRRSLIYLNEYRIAHKLLKRNWKIKVVAPYWELIETENRIRETKFEEILDPTYKLYNPTQHMWKSLSKFHISGVKKSLIFKNPVGIKNSPSNISNALASMYT
jgi:hypothetical protein